MAYPEEEYLMISGIQHFKFCRRQWALIHVEQQWEENVHTVIGELMHKRAHDPYLTEKRAGVLVVRALPVASREMGVSGECDLVEFHKCEDGISLHGHRGQYSVYPVEYKKGKPKLTEEDRLQLRISGALGALPGAWKRCFPQRFPQVLFFMERQGEGRRLCSQKSCGRRCGPVSQKCTNITGGGTRQRLSAERPAVPAL